MCTVASSTAERLGLVPRVPVTIDSYNELKYTHYMSKRLQVLVPDSEYKELQRIARAEHQNVAEWVRESIRVMLQKRRPKSSSERIASILKFARYCGPSGDIDTLLEQIEKGRRIA